MSNAPLLARYNGDGFDLLGRSRKDADASYVIGERYLLELREQRSRASHNQFFALVDELWSNLPEETADRFPTPTHLRKHALIHCGYRDERSIVCTSKAEARRVAAFIAPMDEYAIIIVREAVIQVFTAKSQKEKAMGRKPFQQSKEKVLAWISDLIGVTPKELAEHGEAA